MHIHMCSPAVRLGPLAQQMWKCRIFYLTHLGIHQRVLVHGHWRISLLLYFDLSWFVEHQPYGGTWQMSGKVVLKREGKKRWKVENKEKRENRYWLIGSCQVINKVLWEWYLHLVLYNEVLHTSSIFSRSLCRSGKSAALRGVSRAISLVSTDISSSLSTLPNSPPTNSPTPTTPWT